MHNVNDREEKEQKIIRKMMGYISGKIKSENCSLGNSAGSVINMIIPEKPAQYLKMIIMRIV